MGERCGLWVYGVLAGDVPGPPPCRGVDRIHGVELVRYAGLAAAASRVPLDRFGAVGLRESLEDMRTLEALARGHEHVLDEALRIGAVVPFSMCTVYEREDAVRAMLAREHDALASTLRRLRGMAEWGVKGYIAEDEPDAVAPPASGAEYFARRRAGRDAARAREGAVESVHEQLRAQAADAVLIPSQNPRLSARGGRMLLNAAYLVADAESDAFAALVADLGRRHRRDGIELELTGPWPAYHFTEPRAA